MWIIIILIVVGVLIKFGYATSRQKQQVARQGGMQHKYRYLIKSIQSADPRAKIYKDTGDSVLIGLSNMGGTTFFSITQTFGQVTIQWKLESPIFGKHNLEWEFDEFFDQNKMMEKISNDLTHYQNNVMSSQGFPQM